MGLGILVYVYDQVLGCEEYISYRQERLRKTSELHKYRNMHLPQVRRAGILH